MKHKAQTSYEKCPQKKNEIFVEPCQNYQTQITTKNARVHSCTSYNKLIFYRTWAIVHIKKNKLCTK